MKKLIALALALCLSSAQAQMALTGAGGQSPVPSVGGSVSFDAASASPTAFVGSTTTNNTVTGSGAANSVAIAALAIQPAATSISCTYDPTGANISLTQLINIEASDSTVYARIFGAPIGTGSASSKTISCSWTGSAGGNIVAEIYKGANQTGGATTFPNTASTAGAASATTSISITSAPGHISTDMATQTAGNVTSTNQTLISSVSNAGCCGIGASVSTSPGSTATFTWSGSNSAWAHVGVDISN